jgi:hypothetical protein
VHPWSLKEFEGKFLYVGDQLAAAMRANPFLRVYVASGYHDGATPYFATEHTMSHLAIPDELRAQHLDRVLRGRAHDVRPRAQPARPVRAPARVRRAVGYA